MWEYCGSRSHPRKTSHDRHDNDDNTITLKAICAQFKIDPNDARAKLRTARTDAKRFHTSPSTRQVTLGLAEKLPAVEEVRAALKNGDAT